MGLFVESKVDYWLTEEGLFLIECWARDYSIGEIREKMGNINATTLTHWRRTYPEMEKAFSVGREILDYRVESALVKVALGYKTTETRSIINQMPDKDGNRIVRVEKIEKEIQPNVTAIMCWLNNRKPDSWKRNRDNSLELNDTQSNITVNIVRHGKDDADEDWDATAVKSNKAGAISPYGNTAKNPAPDSWDSYDEDWDS